MMANWKREAATRNAVGGEAGMMMLIRFAAMGLILAGGSVARAQSGVENPIEVPAVVAEAETAVAPVPASTEEAPTLYAKSVRSPARTVKRAALSEEGGVVAVQFTGDGDFGDVEILRLKNPARLVVDLRGVESAPKAAVKGSQQAGIREVRFGRHEGKVRAVLDVADELLAQRYELVRSKNGLRVELGQVAKASPTAKSESKVAQATLSAKGVPAKSAALIKDVLFHGDVDKGTISIAVEKVSFETERPDSRTAMLTLRGAKLPAELERSLDTAAFNAPVKMVSSFVAPGGEEAVKVVASIDGEVSDQVTYKKGRLVWSFTSKSAGSIAEQELVLDGRTLLGEGAQAFTQAAAEQADGFGQSRRPKYVGRRISFEFKDIDIHNLLRVIADISKKNVIIDGDVKGKVTLRLRNVPWDQALDVILKTKKLAKEEMGNIIRILPLDAYETEQRAIAAAIEAKSKSDPLQVRLVPVNYATAKDIEAQIKASLSPRGSVTVDTRSNTLIVTDIAPALSRVEGMVRRLDTQTPQILIEARIVEANTDFSRSFGIQWGGNMGMSSATGNATGLQFPSSVQMAGGVPTQGVVAGTSATPNYAVSLPAAVGDGAGGALGFMFGSASGAVALNLRISAAEQSGKAKTISAPRVTTLDNMTATISQGVSIPYSQTSANGTNTTFVEAKLELKVTPHVTADGSVMMNINATNNQADPTFTGANGQPGISKKEAKTDVLVKDGDTTVIGGIYTRTQSTTQAGIPLLSKIPVLGWLFKNHSEKDVRTELLVFITPRIVNRELMTVAAGEVY